MAALLVVVPAVPGELSPQVSAGPGPVFSISDCQVPGPGPYASELALGDQLRGGTGITRTAHVIPAAAKPAARYPPPRNTSTIPQALIGGRTVSAQGFLTLHAR